MNVAILGCGPTGLIAAHACALRDVGYTIFSKRRKSFLFGSQYLHEPIPGIVEEPEGVWVKYINVGSPEEYRRKTHGKFWDGIAAPEDFETEHRAWNIREAYDRLWQKYGRYVENYEFKSAHETECELELRNYDLVISTVPRTIWKIPGEEYVYSTGWAIGDAPEHGLFVPYDVEDNRIICDGSDLALYNRLSKVFGYTTVEWPAMASEEDINASLPPELEVSKLLKPLRYQPNPHTPNPTDDWLHVGRYGAWQKGVVVTDAWHSVMSKIDELKGN